MSDSRIAASSLRALRDDAARRLAQVLAANDAPLATARELHERLRLLDAALADAAPRPRRWQSPLVAAAVVAAVLSVAALVPVPSVPFSLDAEAAAVRLHLAAAGELEPQAVAGEIVASGRFVVVSPDPALASPKDETADRLAATASPLRLRRISYPESTTLDFAAGDATAALTLHSQRSPIAVEIELAGIASTQISNPPGRRAHDYRYGEWLRLVAGDAAGGASAPLALSLGRSAATPPYAWSALQPSEVRFIERAAGSGVEARVVSSLKQARIALPATRGEVVLAAGDELVLGGLELERFDLRLGAMAKLQLSGTASRLTTRTGRFERDLKPSWLEYAARHRTVELLWSAALLLWGIARWLHRPPA